MPAHRLALAMLAALAALATSPALAAPSRLDLTLRGGYRASSVGFRHVHAMVEVEGSLDALALPRRIGPGQPPSASERDDAGSERAAAAVEREAGEGQDEDPDASSGTPSAGTGDRSRDAAMVVAHLVPPAGAEEPHAADGLAPPERPSRHSTREESEAPREPAGAREPAPALPPLEVLAPAAVRAAWRAAGLAGGLAELDGMAARARTSAVLPDLRLRAGRSTDQSLRLTPTTADPYRYTEAGGYDVFFDASATWRLGRLVFADEEVAVERLRLQHVAARSRVAERVVAALFAWQRAHADIVAPELDDSERRRAAGAVLEAELLLDVLTDGWFRARLSRLPPPGRGSAGGRQKAAPGKTPGP